jgi:hypothetical protein
MEFLCKVTNLEDNSIMDLYTNKSGAGLFFGVNDDTKYKQLIGNMQIQFTGTKAQARYQLKKNMKLENCKISFKDSVFIV